MATPTHFEFDAECRNCTARQDKLPRLAGGYDFGRAVVQPLAIVSFLASKMMKKTKALAQCHSCETLLAHCTFCKTWQVVDGTNYVQCIECVKNFIVSWPPPSSCCAR